jgi:cleavage and polyadenylation specificity factor subunit 6/7
MALDSVSDEWMYNEVLDDELAEVTNNDNAVRRVSIDSTDLLDDVLTLPSSTTKQISEPEDLNFLQEAEENGVPMEDSASPRFNADRIAKTVQARIESNKTSQSFSPSQLLTIYSRDPNKKNSIFIGNMTWWTTDIDILSAVKEVGLGDVKCLKFFENRTNGQSKGLVIFSIVHAHPSLPFLLFSYALIELSSEAVALGAPDKLQTLYVTVNESFNFIKKLISHLKY